MKHASKNNTSIARFNICVHVVLLLLVQILNVNADSRRTQQYGYDSSGNLIQSNTQVSGNPPSISSITPNLVPVGIRENIQVIGSDLYNAQVSSSYTGLTISNVQTTPVQITFDVFVSDFTTGTADLVFTTTLGSVTSSIIIEFGVAE